MSTMTAHIIIGKAHRFEGGINPRYELYLSENDRPCWILLEGELTFENKIRNRIIKKWIPTIEHMLEDGLLMFGLYVLKDEALVQMAKQYFHIDYEKNKTITLYKDVSQKGLEMMRMRARQLESEYKLSISVFDGSSIYRSLRVIKDYKVDVEVCISVFIREYSVWKETTVERGELPAEDASI